MTFTEAEFSQVRLFAVSVGFSDDRLHCVYVFWDVGDVGVDWSSAILAGDCTGSCGTRKS